MNDTVKAKEEMVAPLEKIKQQLTEPAVPKAGGLTRFVAVLALLLVLLTAAGLAAIGYYLWPQWQALQQQQNRFLQTQQQLEAQHQEQLAAAELLQKQHLQQLQDTRRTLQQQQEQQAEQTAIQLQALRQQLLQRDSAPPRHWVLSEAQYLLQLAGNKVWLEQDLTTARLLLSSADEKLASLDDSSLLVVRQAIAADQQQLGNLHKPDLQAVYLKLHQLQQLTASLPLKQQEQALTLTLPEPGNRLENWRSTLSYYWHNTWSKVIQVRSAVPEDYFSLSAEQQLMLRVSLNQQLMLAELAAIRQQQEVYTNALQQAAAKLQRYFVPDNETVLLFGEQLTELTTRPVSALTVEPLKSLPQLQQYLQSLGSAEDNL
ncbi:uroporphyrinogen-III C-methyltransferase [Chromatiaceae bacterium AAb-1]|nr:uroporphyrinogen-III C-methyltransferase [Chromatiaceae bacterium AAb-1]